MIKPRALLAVFAMAVVLCCQSVPDESTSSGTDCASHMWPRIIAGVAGGAEDRVTVKVRLADGTILDGHRHGCPGVTGIICSYSFFTAPRDKEVVLLVQGEHGAVERRIALPPFTHEGRNVMYVEITVRSDGPPLIGDPRIINPC